MKYFYLILVVAALLIHCSAVAQDAKRIMEQASQVSYHQGSTYKTNVDMAITDRKGRVRHRVMTMLRKNMEGSEGQQKYFVYFKKPMDVNRMVFMVWKNSDRTDDRWLYLPAMDLVNRIASGDEGTSFVGSHFVYEDVSGRDVEKDVHEIVREDDQYYVIKSTPKRDDLKDFKHKLSWIDKESFLPRKVTFYNKGDAIYRTYSVLETAEIDGFPTIKTSRMEDNLTGGYTILHFSDSQYDLTVPTNIFTERYLRRPPLKLILK